MINFLTKLISPLFGTIDKLDISGNAKQQIKNELAAIQKEANEHILEFEKALVQEQTKRIEAESKSDGWLQKNWRPISSLSLVIAIIAAAYGIGKPGPELYHLAEIIIGVNMGGRTLEKVASVVKLGK